MHGKGEGVVGKGVPEQMRLQLEPLEPRILLSGVVAIKLSGGSLSFTGDGYDNELLIQRTGEYDYLITPQDGTLINLGFGATSDPQAISGVTKDLKLKMGGGADDVDILGGAPGSINFDGGAGNNSLYVYEATVGKNITAKNKGAYAEFELNGADVYGGITVSNSGSGSTELYDADISGQVSITNKGFGNLAIGGVSIYNALKVTNGSGGSSTLIQDFEIDGITIKNKDGFDSLVLEDGVVYGNVSINNGTGGSSTVLDPVGVLGNFTLTNGAGGNTFEADDLYVWGNLTITNGTGDTSLDMDYVQVGGNVLVTDGTGFDDVEIEDLNASGNVTLALGNGGSDVYIDTDDGGNYVGGSLAITAGSGENDIWLGDSEVVGVVSIVTGSSNDVVTIEDLDPVALYVNTGNGNDTVYLKGDAEIDSSLVVQLGAGDDDLYVGEWGSITLGGTATFDGGVGYDEYLIYNGFDYVLISFEGSII